MAVDVIAPDARKKVDELFLYWLSEPSTQDILRQELARMCGLQQQQQKFDILGPAVYSNHRSRPTSPIVRDVTPPPGPSTSPSRSPKPNSNLLESQTAEITSKTRMKEEIDGGEPAPVSSLVGTKTEAEASDQETLPATTTANFKPACIPPFYFPKGQPKATKDSRALQKAERILQRYANQEITKKDFVHVVKVSQQLICTVVLLLTYSIVSAQWNPSNLSTL